MMLGCKFLSRTMTSIVLACAGSTAVFAQGAAVTGPSLAPAPYSAPAVGTVRVFSAFSHRVTKVSGWRTEVVDEYGRRAAQVGGFLIDNPLAPAIMDTALLRKLWPLKVGNAVEIGMQRFPEIRVWRLEVIGSERITVPAGTFDTYVIDAAVTAFARGRTVTAAQRTLYHYAPDIGEVVRITTAPAAESQSAPPSVAELVRLERRGKAPVGMARPPAAPSVAPVTKPWSGGG